MRFLATPLTLILDRMQRRFRLSRPGSVLILVVALLVLMALIGTAYISTTRIDRYAVKDNQTANTLDLAAASILDTTANAVDNDLYDGTNYRAVSTDPQVPSTYDNWDGISVPGPSMNLFTNSTVWNNTATPAVPIADPNDAWLAARYPRLINPYQGMSITGNRPIWTSISYPPFQNLSKALKTAHPNYFWEFRGPDVADNKEGFLLSLPKMYFLPTYKTIGGKTYPALQARWPLASGAVSYGAACGWDYSSPANNTERFLAADADGDGIADAGLWPLPMGEIDGVRFYAAIRIIDNNSALNVNTAWAQGDANYEGDRTAWSNDPTDTARDETRADQLVNYYFPNSIALGSLLRTFNMNWWNALSNGKSGDPDWQGAEMEALKQYWWDTKARPTGMDTRNDTDTTHVWRNQLAVLDDQGNARATNIFTPPASYEFLYNSIGDAMYHELGRRPDHPGMNYDESNTIPGYKTEYKNYQSFGAQDAMALAYHFCLINPNAGMSPLEQLFYNVGEKGRKPDSLYLSAPNAPTLSAIYTPPLGQDAVSYPQSDNAVLEWFKDNFDYDAMATGNTANSEVRDQGASGYHPNYHSRRTMLVTRNPVSNQSPRRNMNGLWDMDALITGIGTDWAVVGPVTLNSGSLSASAFTNYDGTSLANAGFPDFVWGEQMPYWNDSTKYNYTGYVAPKASANTASFGELWRAFWNVMSVGDGTHTPFDKSFEGTIGQTPVNATQGLWGYRDGTAIPGDNYTLNDPYVGQKFWDEDTRDTINSAVYPFCAQGDDYDMADEKAPNFNPRNWPFTLPGTQLTGAGPIGWNPARMFRSSIRATPITAPAGTWPGQGLEVNQTSAFDQSTPRFPAFQELLLRAAIAAVNTQDMRDSDYDKDVVDIALSKAYPDANGAPTTQPLQDPSVGLTPTTPDQRDFGTAPSQVLMGHGTGDVTAHRIRLSAVLENTFATLPQNVNVVVYGYEKQPFITEVFVDTDTSSFGPGGYVAIELYNPYDHDIEMNNWKLVAIDRRHDTSATTGQYGLHFQNYATDPNHELITTAQPSSTELIADFDPERQGQQAEASGDTIQQVWPSTLDPATLKDRPLIVPAHGYLLLENYPSTTATTEVGVTLGTAVSTAPPTRPKASGLPPTGDILQENRGTDRSYRYQAGQWVPNNNRASLNLPQLNVAFVPGLSGLTDQAWSRTTGPTSDQWPGMRSVLNRELVLLRPRRADGKYSAGFYPPLYNVNQKQIADAMRYDENWALTDLVPVDSFDFTGLQLPGAGPGALYSGGTQAAIWHYVRQNADAAPATLNPASGATQFEPGQWKFVYPGRYDACPASGANWTAGVPYPGNPLNPTQLWGADLTHGRQQGTEVFTFPVNAGPTTWPPPSPTHPFTPVTLGDGPSGMNNNNITASYPTRFPIQLDAEGWQRNSLISTGWEGLNSSTGAYISNLPSPALFPFGGFARNGDLMQIPFIGAYRISRVEPPGYTPLPAYNDPTNPGNQIGAEPPPGSDIAALQDSMIELNSITMDSVFAEDTDLDDDPRFQMYDSGNPPIAGNIVTTGNVDPMSVGAAQKWTPDIGTTQGREQIGRFCPLITPMRGGDTRFVAAGQTDPNTPIPEYVNPSDNARPYVPASKETVLTNNYLGFAINDYADDPSFRPAEPTKGLDQVGADWGGYWRYHWATRLFDFLTVQAPHDDAMADIPIQQPWQFNTDYTVGQVVTYTDRINKTLRNGVPNPLYMVPCAYVCTVAHNSGLADFQMGFNASPFNWNQDPQYWHLLARVPQSNSGGKAGNGADPQSFAREYPQGVEGLININTANWKVLSTLPLIVNPNSGLTVDPNADLPGYPDGDVPIPQLANITRRSDGSPLTYRALNEELAKAIEYYRDVDGQPNAAGAPWKGGTSLRIPHGPFKSIYELNAVVDLRPFTDWKYANNATALNPFYGHGFADAMGLLAPYLDGAGFPHGMYYMNPDRDLTQNPTWVQPLPGDGDPDGGLNDLSPGKNFSLTDPNTGKRYAEADGVRGDFEEQFLQLDRISNLISTRSDSFTCYVLVQGWKNAGSQDPAKPPTLVVQKRVAYIIDRSMVPYHPEKKTLVPNN